MSRWRFVLSSRCSIRRKFFHAYLFASLFVVGLAVGSLAVVMIHHLTGARLGFYDPARGRSPNENIAVGRLIVRAGFVRPAPHLCVGVAIDTRRRIEWVSLEPLLGTTILLLAPVGYFVAWLVLMSLMAAWSPRPNELPNVRTYWKTFKASGPGLLVLGITLHFASIDWIMSLEPGFTSTIFGPLLFSSQLLAAFSLSVMIFCWLVGQPEFENIRSNKVMNDLGSLMFTFLVLWAYLAWFQFMLVWIADLPHGNVWYLIRSHGAWHWLTLYLIMIHFAVPFVLLLFRAVKQSRRRLGVVPR